MKVVVTFILKLKEDVYYNIRSNYARILIRNGVRQEGFSQDQLEASWIKEVRRVLQWKEKRSERN